MSKHLLSPDHPIDLFVETRDAVSAKHRIIFVKTFELRKKGVEAVISGDKADVSVNSSIKSDIMLLCCL